MSVDQDKYPEDLVFMREGINRVLLDAGIDMDKANPISAAIVDHIRRNHGGMYLPKGYASDISARDREIGKRWNGTNMLELCREYNITDKRVYQILARLRAEHREARQIKMFE